MDRLRNNDAFGRRSFLAATFLATSWLIWLHNSSEEPISVEDDPGNTPPVSDNILPNQVPNGLASEVNALSGEITGETAVVIDNIVNVTIQPGDLGIIDAFSRILGDERIINIVYDEIQDRITVVRHRNGEDEIITYNGWAELFADSNVWYGDQVVIQIGFTE